MNDLEQKEEINIQLEQNNKQEFKKRVICGVEKGEGGGWEKRYRD